MDQTASKLSAVVEKYCDSLPSEIRKLVQLLEQLQDPAGQSRPDKLEDLHHELHRMAGAAHCMGFGFLGYEFTNIEFLTRQTIDSPADRFHHNSLEIASRICAVARIASKVSTRNSDILNSGSEPGPVTAPPVGRSEAGAPMEDQRILFVDDDSSIRQLMKDVLVSLNVGAVMTSANGQEAIDTVGRFNPTILVTDWHMKPVNGIELLQKIRSGATPIDPDCVIIFLTSSKTAKDVHHVIAKGADHFLVKPFTRKSVETSISRVLARRSQEVAFV